MENKLKPLKLYAFILIIVLTVATLPCSKKETKDIQSPKSTFSESGNPLFSEKFKKVGWINNSRYRAVIHIQTYEKCKNTSHEELCEHLEMIALRNIQHELKTGLSREASIQILNLIKDHGIILKPESKCSEINICYLDIVKENLKSVFRNIQSIK